MATASSSSAAAGKKRKRVVLNIKDNLRSVINIGKTWKVVDECSGGVPRDEMNCS